jgi:hypothetical protein
MPEIRRSLAHECPLLTLVGHHYPNLYPAGSDEMALGSGREIERHSRIGCTRRSGGGESGRKLADDLDITIDAELRLILEIVGQV